MIIDHTGTNLLDTGPAARRSGVAAGDALLTPRTQVRRHAERAAYDRTSIHAILDAGTVCHLAFAVDGRPWAVPMAYGRSGDVLYLHGAAANHALRSAGNGVEACATVTVLDGLVLARSAFHHSMNYRCAMVFGVAQEVTEPEAKQAALAAIVDHLLPGRWDEARPPDPSELRATQVVALPIQEASAKVRTGGPADKEADHALPIWAGQVPLALVAGAVVPDAGAVGTAVPASLLERWT